MMAAAKNTLVLVTGASGFIAGHCVRELLEHGYAVRVAFSGRRRRLLVQRR